GIIWVLDGILQYQPSMFTKSFPDMLAESAHGNPGVMAGPITWSANLIDHHVVVLNAIFATIQLALGLGIAWRPTLRLALTASIALAVLLALLAVAVYLPAPALRAAIVLAVVLAAALWLAQGMGEFFTGMATDPESGPLLALLALAFWPAVPMPAVPMPAVSV